MKYKEKYLAGISDELADSNKLAIVTGVPGSGKDYLVNQLSPKAHPDQISIFNFGEMMHELIRLEISGRDSIRTSLTHKQVEDIAKKIIEKIINQQPGLVNTHVAYKQNQSFVINPNSFSKLNPHSFVYVWSDPEQIVKWRNSDSERPRDIETPELVSLHQAIAIEASYQLAIYLKSRFISLYNHAGNNEKNITMLLEELSLLQSINE